MSFRDEPPAAGAESAGDEPVYDQGAPGTAEPGTAVEQPTPPVEEPAAAAGQTGTPKRAGNMLPGRARRRFGVERLLMRVIATAGIVGIGVGIAAILAASNVQGWIIGLVVATVSVVLSGLLWSSRQL